MNCTNSKESIIWVLSKILSWHFYLSYDLITPINYLLQVLENSKVGLYKERLEKRIYKRWNFLKDYRDDLIKKPWLGEEK